MPTFTPPPHIAPSLSPLQQTAISLLCAGHNLQTVAVKLHVSRMTLHRWRTQHPAFQAELNRRQFDLHDTAARRLRLTLLQSLALVTDEIRTARYQSDRVKAALALLRRVDVSQLLAPPASLTTDACTDDLIRRDRQSRNLDPTLPIDNDDRDHYLSDLDANHTFDAPPPPPPPTAASAKASPYPTPDNTPPQDPDYQI